MNPTTILVHYILILGTIGVMVFFVVRYTRQQLKLLRYYQAKANAYEFALTNGFPKIIELKAHSVFVVPCHADPPEAIFNMNPEIWAGAPVLASVPLRYYWYK